MSFTRDVRQHCAAAVSHLQEGTIREARWRTGFEPEATASLEQMDSIDKLKWCQERARAMAKTGCGVRGTLILDSLAGKGRG